MLGCGQVAALGCGQVAAGADDSASLLRVLNGAPSSFASALGAGGGGTYAWVTPAGDLYTWGRGVPAGILGHGDTPLDEPQPKLVCIHPLILQPLFCCNCVLQVLALCHIKTFTRRAVKDAQVRFAQLFRPSRKINRGLE
jgi:hypothetical protein